MVIAWIDIDPTTGIRNKLVGGTSLNASKEGALGLYGHKFAFIKDGLSNTALIFESSGRVGSEVRNYDPTTSIQTSASGVSIGPPVQAAWGDLCQGKSCPTRWADQNSGSGVSGPPNLISAGKTSLINQNKVPFGGPSTCPWSQNNCGPNNEPFSVHDGGAHALMGDGTVHFISENTDNQVVRRICDPNDGEPLGITF